MSRKHLVVATAAIFVTASWLALFAFANGVTKQQLLDLQRAGVDESIIIQKINNDGVAFAVTTDDMIELRKAGFTNATIKVLLDKKSPSIYPTAKALFNQAKYPELIDLLKKQIAADSADYKSRSLLVLTLAKQPDVDRHCVTARNGAKPAG